MMPTCGACSRAAGCCSEPDSYGLTWLGTQLKGQGLGYWYHQIMKIGYAINPSACSSARSRLPPNLRFRWLL